MPKGEGVHVVPNKNDGKKWAVKFDGKLQKEFDIKAKAKLYATKLAKSEATELTIHNLDGQIGEKNSFGNDPNPPRG